MNVLGAQSDTKIIMHWDNRLINFSDTMRTFTNYLNIQRAFLLPTSQEWIVAPEMLENEKRRRRKKKQKK
jgi:hypothetical protein